MRTLSCLALFAVVACGDSDGDTADTHDHMTTTGGTTTGTTTGGTTTGTTTGGTTTGGTTSTTSIEGQWIDPYNGTHTITESTWTIDGFYGVSLFHIDSWDPKTQTLYAQNDASNGFAAEQWSRFDWTWDGADLYFCQSAYDAPDLQAAMATPRADDTDLQYGCGANGFPWSALSPL